MAPWRRLVRRIGEPGRRRDTRILERRFDPAVRDARDPSPALSREVVAQYYADNTDAYVQGFGEIFQGSRPESTDALIDYLIDAAQLAPGQRILDAGCGIGGPARAFAQRLDCNIEGVTIAQAQVDEAARRAAATTMKGRVTVRHGDFHDLPSLFPSQVFDRILMLESLCHAEDFRTVLNGCRALLAPGGKIYIKDFYAVDWRSRPDRAEAQAADLRRLNEIYALKIPDLGSLVDVAGEAGFQLEYLRMPMFDPSYDHWVRYEQETGRPWNPTSGAPGEVIQGFELLARG